MSDIPTDYGERLNLREQIERIDRMRAETQKFTEERYKLTAEQQKLTAEQLKLAAEAAKLGRDRLLAPWVVIVGLIGSVIGLTGGIMTVLGALARSRGLGG